MGSDTGTGWVWPNTALKGVTTCIITVTRLGTSPGYRFGKLHTKGWWLGSQTIKVFNTLQHDLHSCIATPTSSSTANIALQHPLNTPQ